jgi:hypothetical protein
VALAKERLREWMAAGKVPWSCMSWEGRPAEGIVDLLNLGSVAYYPGDPQFWCVGHLNIDWEDNGARERGAGGAQALGIKVSRAHVQALLPATTAGEPMLPPDQRRKAGAKPKYDWDAIQAHCHQWFDDSGFPENVSAFCRDKIIPWCEQRYGEDGTPDMETLRPLVTRWIAAWERSLLPK